MSTTGLPRTHAPLEPDSWNSVPLRQSREPGPVPGGDKKGHGLGATKPKLASVRPGLNPLYYNLYYSLPPLFPLDCELLESKASIFPILALHSLTQLH